MHNSADGVQSPALRAESSPGDSGRPHGNRWTGSGRRGEADPRPGTTHPAAEPATARDGPRGRTHAGPWRRGLGTPQTRTLNRPPAPSLLDSKPRDPGLRKHACHLRADGSPHWEARSRRQTTGRRATPGTTPRRALPAPALPVQPQHSPVLRTQPGLREAACCTSPERSPRRGTQTQWTRESN